MLRTCKLALLIAAATFAVLPLRSQTSSSPKPSFDVISIKSVQGYCLQAAGVFRGDRYTAPCSNLRTLLQRAYQRLSRTPIAPIQTIGGPNWIDSDRYAIEAKVNCSDGALSIEQMQLMIRSMLEDRFKLKAHIEIREEQVYNLVVAKNPPKIKLSESQTPIPQQPPVLIRPPCSPTPEASADPVPPALPSAPQSDLYDLNKPAPRGFVGITFSLAAITLRGSAVPIARMVSTLQRYVASPIIDKTNLTGMFDFAMRFNHEGLVNFDGMPFSPGIPGVEAADPMPTLFTAIQELGLKLEPGKGPVEVLVVESVQKPTVN